VRAELQVRIWDITTDIRLPAFMCLAASRDEAGDAEPEFGAGCHADADVALSRALAEAAQARVTVISGARDDIGAAGYRPGIRIERQEAAARLMRAPPHRRFCVAPSCAGETLERDCETALRRLDTVALRRVAWVDLTRPEFGIPVVRVVIPGLEGPWTPPAGEYTPGRRACAALPCPA
jgi:ribosomal protein S12 methylthiotransferase accessory factor